MPAETMRLWTLVWRPARTFAPCQQYVRPPRANSSISVSSSRCPAETTASRPGFSPRAAKTASLKERHAGLVVGRVGDDGVHRSVGKVGQDLRKSPARSSSSGLP